MEFGEGRIEFVEKTFVDEEQGELLCRKLPWPLQRPPLVQISWYTWSYEEEEDERREREVWYLMNECGCDCGD